MERNKVLIIATAGLTTDLLYNSLAAKTDVVRVILENPESKWTIIKRRKKKLGWAKTSGQVLFLAFIKPFIPKRNARIQAIIEGFKMSSAPIPLNKIERISSVHDPGLIERIKSFDPDFIVINGTRILKKELLQTLPCPMVNIHVGITPKYRGVHGGYWAIHFNDPQLFGVTLHYVNKGIDTGKIIAQSTISTGISDNFNTYPVLQYASGIQLLLDHIEEILNYESSKNRPLTDISKLHYHPTAWEYLFGRHR